VQNMTRDEMKDICGGVSWWCIGGGIVAGIAISTGPLGLVTYGPIAVGLIAACIICE
jgi:hypothetical protein